MDDSSDLKLQLLDELCDKLDESGIEGNVIERDSNGKPYVNIWYGQYAYRPESGEMFTVVITDNSLYISPSGCYEITPPGKYRDYFKDTFPARRSSSGFYAWIMPSDLIIRTIKSLFDRENKENVMSNWENEKRILEDATESINRKMDTCFVANMCTRADTQEPVILVQDLCSHYIFEIYYDYKNKKYSIVPRGDLGCIADNSHCIRNSIHNGFGFSNIPHGFLRCIYDEWKDKQRSEIKKENNMNNFTLATKLFGKLNKAGIDFRFKNGIYNQEEIIITAKDSKSYKYDIALVRSVPYSEDSDRAYQVRWLNVPSFILARHGINRVQGYDWSDNLIDDILRVEKELESIKYRESCICPHGIVDVIFNDPATIIIWADGSKTVVKAENEKFDPEKGLAMAISKKVLGNKHDYYEVFKRYVGRYEKKQDKKERAAQARANKNVKPTDSNKDKKQKLDNERC